jgi:DNA-binding NarL/FixJ family response regulator
MSEIQVIVADDHAVVRAGLQRIIANEGDIDVVAEASTGEQLYHLFNQLNPHVLLIGCLYSRGMSGVEAVRRILLRHPKAKVIVYTLHDDLAFAGFSLNSGVKGFITGLTDTNELVKAIREVAIGKVYISSNMAEKIAIESLSEQENPIKTLSTREFEMFRLLAQGCSVKDISEILNVASKTVANYQTNIKHKLDIHSPVDIVRLAIKYDVIKIH